ncbi:MFS transporter [Nocardiopsis changdeensis]|uniref:MFS transporter n=1 Tax=Nocardiopsis changdeensis TaxID=2831969 RepID=A0ABX8BIE1_9ACTN|nr:MULTISPECIES: MFS transporter [Nocardiopsis]QUX21168.1 MFS transporter [Nocardiopsis changdeensis]QYX37098.1 MFS transporter [Nocardiopsis sp. MT53]
MERLSPPAREHARTSPRGRAAVAVLASATFTVVTSEMLPVGVLTPMAQGLGVSPGAAGTSLTVTGLVAAAVAPVVPRLLGDLDRRVVLAAAMAVLGLGNLLTALAGGFGLLVVSRIVLGIGMGAVWGLAAAVAVRLVAPRDAALAVSVTVGGVAAASVLGVPLGTLVGGLAGWRAAFAVFAALAFVLAIGLAAVLPRLRRPEPAGAEDGGERRRLLRPAVAAGLAAVALLVVAHFAAYTYVRPVLEDRAGFPAGAIAVLLLLYGVFGLAGNFGAGALAARRPGPTVLLLAGGIAAAVAVLAASGTAAAAVAAVALWGAAYGGLSVSGQLWMTAAAPDRVEHVTGLYVGVFTASIALGAFAGGAVVDAAGTAPLLWGAAGLALAALAVGALGAGVGAGGRPGPRDQSSR